MSKILLDKINNILDIDKTKEYIVLNNFNDFINLQDYVDKEELENFLNGNLEQIKIVANENYDQILENVKECNSYESLNEFLIDNQINLQFSFTPNIKTKLEPIEYEKLAIEDFLANKNKNYQKVNEFILSGINLFKELDKKAKKAFVDQGKQMLKLGFNFIQGHIEEKYIFAPLFLQEIEIKIIENVVYLTKVNQTKELNEKLIIYILKEFKLDHNHWDLNKINTLDDFTTLLESILQYKIEKETENPFHQDKKLYRLIKNVDCYFLGLYDSKPGKIKEDFIELMNNNILLLNDKMKHDFEFYCKEEFEQDALVQINNPLNIYQKYALRSAINENTLIYGPPGTGKSEIITSMIANLMIQSKTILVVSEKDAALDVIKKRLGKLSSFVFYLKDIEKEDEFYNQIEYLSEHMGSFYNDEYKNSNFNLQQVYANNERIIDYNKEIKKFRSILQEQIDFSLEKDSRNNDYRDYLISINLVEEFVKNNKTGINEFWEEYKNKYVKLQSATEFIAKVAEFNWFKSTYELSEEEIEKFEKMRFNLTRFLVDNDLINYKIESFEELKNKVDKLEEFLKHQMMHKDKNFINEIENDCYFLSNNYKRWKHIEQMFEGNRFKNQVKRFLLRNSIKHERFLSRRLILSAKQQQKLDIRYFWKSDIRVKKVWFKPKQKQEFWDNLLIAIREVEEMKLFKSNIYLDKMLKEHEDIFHPLIIYFYQNKTLLKKSFIDFYNKQVVNFDLRIIHQYFKYRVNQIERELININIYRFEKLSKNKHIIERDLPWIIKQYLKNNQDFILNIDQAIYDTYIKFIKNKLANSSKDIQEKVEQMFKVVRMEKRPKINDFINSFIDCLYLIFPIWVSKPDLLAHYTENKKELFDVGIFDEASQMFLEKAYPIIYRCKYIIVSGDDKQLKPERLLFNKYEDDPDYRPLVNEVEFDKSESLLDRAKVSYWNTYTLRNHYRSLSKDLIEFSNLHFYDNKLLFSTINYNKIQSYEVVEITKSQENNGINIVEAKKVITKLNQEVKNFAKTLVICFTTAQRQYILELIQETNSANLIERLKRNTLVIGDISSVQGDEGDLVIISSVFTKDSKDYPLICEPRGANYLNVAITRAKEKLIVIKSLNKDQVKFDPDGSYQDQLIFKNWIGYLDSKLNQTKTDVQQTLNKANSSNFKKDLYQTIIKNPKIKKYKVVQNLAIGSENIDIALYSKTIHDIDLVLKLDDWKKCLSIQEWFEDIDKEEYLSSRKYKVLRIQEIDWLKDKQLIIDQIIKHLDD